MNRRISLSPIREVPLTRKSSPKLNNLREFRSSTKATRSYRSTTFPSWSDLNRFTMNLEFSLNTRKNGPYYVGYTPAPCTLRITDGQPANPAVAIILANNNPNAGGQLLFYTALNGPGSATLTLQVPSDGTT